MAFLIFPYISSSIWGESCPLLVLACANGHLRTELPRHHAPKIPPQTSRVSPKPKDL